jgi:hypothetical protein
LGAALQADGDYEVRGDGLKHQKEKRSMDHFAGLDVSVKETSVCIVDDAPVHVKTLRSQKLQMLLTHRKLLWRLEDQTDEFVASADSARRANCREAID